MRLAVNVIGFQLGWLLCVWGGAQGSSALGLGAALAVVLGHLWLSEHRRAEAQLVLVCGAVGFTWDSIAAVSGMFVYPPGASLAPAWILALWAMFATTLNVSLRWLRERLWLAGLAGALGGASAWAAGAAMGAVTLQPAPAALATQAAAWAVLLPALLVVARRLEGEPRAAAALGGA